MVAPTKFGIIGLGWVARDYMLPAIKAAGDRVQLTAVLSASAADFTGLPLTVRRFTSLDRFLADSQVEAVYIATPNHLHRAQAIACLEAGVHVLCEKPLALTRDAVREMQEAAIRNRRLLVTAYDQRHHPAHREMKRWLEQEKLGAITQARIDYACWLPAEWSTDNWRIDRAKAGGGAIIDLAPHGMDLLEWLLVDPIEKVHCFQQAKVQNYTVDDGGVLSHALQSGTLASHVVAYNRPETLPRRTLEIIGTKGILKAENTMGQDPGGTLTYTDASNGTPTTIEFDTTAGPFEHQLTHFLDRIATDPTDNNELTATLRQVGLLETALIKAASEASPTPAKALATSESEQSNAVAPSPIANQKSPTANPMLTHYACTHCGGWILWFNTREPIACPNCMDVRNALPEEDFTYLHIDAAKGKYTTKWREALPGLWEFWTEPQLGLGSHGWLIIREEGNIAFEAAPYYDEASRRKIEDLGGITILGASHPHGYGALWQLQEQHQPDELIIHRDDLVQTKAFKVNRPIDDHYIIDEQREMRRLGGHYEGQTALYDDAYKIMFLGDALKIDFGPDGVTPMALSCHKGYHYAIPLTRGELMHYREVFGRYDFEHVCTPFEFGLGVGRSESIALVDYLLDTGIHTGPVPLELLKKEYADAPT